MRAVDINHNFNAYWHKLRQMEIEDGITGPAMTRYGGTYPESEPESKYLADLTRKCEFGYTLAFHSQGEEIYYGFDDYLPPNAEHMAKDLPHQADTYCQNRKDWLRSEDIKIGLFVDLGGRDLPLK